MAEFKFPTEEVELPSKGLLYPEGHPLKSGKIEIKYMTAKEEDILSNSSYIQKGIVLDKLLESVIVTKVPLKDLLIGDKNAILIAARILGYGATYKVTINGEEERVDLTQLENKPFDESYIVNGQNEFSFTLPNSGNLITFKMLDGHDEAKIEAELKGLAKINKEHVPTLTTRLKFTITSIDGDTEKKTIREFVDGYLLARDSRSLREHIKNQQPDVDMSYTLDNGEEVEIPLGLTFFWPDF
jgi:hypothetical protein|tara:strand:- start:9690 stop:10415 length:726 start_codon:yes stop_codon:yes gene_type:complete